MILLLSLSGVGPLKVHRQLEQKRKMAANAKADSVRASGHGLFPNSAASVTSRASTVASNKELAAEMRHEYMEQLMYRSHQQRQLVETVQQATASHKMEARAARLRLHELEKERLEQLRVDREEAKRVAKQKKEASQARIRAMHDKLLADAKNSTALRMANSARIQRLEKLKKKMEEEASAS